MQTSMVKVYHVGWKLGKEFNQKWAKMLLFGLIAKVRDEAHYTSKKNKLTALSKEVEILLEYGWWAKHEMITKKYSLHKERKEINVLEFAKLIETHLLVWLKCNLKMDRNCLKLIGNSKKDGVWAVKLIWGWGHKVNCGLSPLERKSFKLKCKWHGIRLREWQLVNWDHFPCEKNEDWGSSWSLKGWMHASVIITTQ